MTDKRDRWQVIGRGKAGWHAAAPNVTSSGGSLEPYTYWTGKQCDGYAREAVDGALVYDAQHADDDAFTRFVISGPMLNLTIGPDDVQRFSDNATAARMAPHMVGAFRSLATLAADDSYSGLDYVGLNVYRRLLEHVPGIRFGTIKNGRVIWNDARAASRFL